MNNIICPKCHETIDCENPLHCPFCGICLNNYCTNTECEYCDRNIHHEYEDTLKHTYKFCPSCGSKTTFFSFLTDDSTLKPQNGQ